MPTYRLNLDNGRSLDIDSPNLEEAINRAGRSYPGATIVAISVLATGEPEPSEPVETDETETGEKS